MCTNREAEREGDRSSPILRTAGHLSRGGRASAFTPVARLGSGRGAELEVGWNFQGELFLNVGKIMGMM